MRRGSCQLVAIPASLLLETAEQQLFSCLAVFVGGFTLSAAEAIVGDPRTDALDLLTLISSLVDQSLLWCDETTGHEPRFGMLEPIREFALDRLSASTEAPMLRERHAACYLALATEAEVQIIGQHQVAWLRALQDELPNIRFALEWLRAEHRIDDGLDLIGSLSQFWYRGNHFSEVGVPPGANGGCSRNF
jgi:predicted ATPase